MSKDFYSEEITTQSFIELKKFLCWMYDKKGVIPIIIGGWAVWSYVKGKGSRDIDAVFYDEHSISYILIDEYFANNGYRVVKRGLIPLYYSKNVMTSNGEREIIFDIFDASKNREDEEGLGITIPWGWTVQYRRKIKLVENLEMYVPVPELLIVLKIVAALGRSVTMKTSAEPERYRSKIWKDYYDVALLIKSIRLNHDSLRTFLTDSNVNKHIIGFLKGYKLDEHKNIFAELEIDYKTIEDAFRN